MQGTRPHKSVSFADEHQNLDDAIDLQSSQIRSEEDLKSRLSIMKRYLDSLKYQLDTEKNMLQKEKLELYNYTRHHQETKRRFEHIPNPAIPQLMAVTRQPLDILDQPSKQHLKDIEEKCDVELERLQKYVENIKDLRSYWQFLKSYHVNELGQRRSSGSNRSLQARRMHEGVPSAEWLNKNRTFV